MNGLGTFSRIIAGGHFCFTHLQKFSNVLNNQMINYQNIKFLDNPFRRIRGIFENAVYTPQVILYVKVKQTKMT